MTKQFILALVVSFIPLILSAQEECTAVGNNLYETIPLREYRLDRIDKGAEPTYQRDLPKGDYLTVLDIYKAYAIVVYKSDTFTVEPKFLQSSCLSEKLQRIERERQREEHEKQKIVLLNQERNKQKWINYLAQEKDNIKPLSTTIARINLLAILSSEYGSVSLHSKDSVELVGYKNDTAYVFHKGCLYQTVLKDLISPVADSLLAIFTEQEAEKEKNREIALEQEAKRKKAAGIAAMNKRKANLIDKYGESIANLIIQHKVKIGMTKEMARESWGIPEDINKTTNQYGTFEQWVYGGGNYLYFDNGVLTTIQN